MLKQVEVVHNKDKHAMSPFCKEYFSKPEAAEKTDLWGNSQITGTFESAVITGGFSLKHASSHVCKVASNTFWLSCSR